DMARVAKSCKEDSHWKRSGILSSHPRYGSIPKLIFACIMGYFAGKLSYVKTCQEKFKMWVGQERGPGMGNMHNRSCSLDCEECKLVLNPLSHNGNSAKPSLS
uniref:OCIA domain-containing protein 1 n=1 Tax=Sus scrofa TaxID=9823 RepID=A0A8D1XN88_PIG